MRRVYFRKLVFDDAQAKARMKPVRGGRSLLGAPLWTYRALLLDSGRLLRGLGRPGTFDRELAWWSSAGRLCGYWKGA
jgi:hypothetical protein